MAPEIGTRLAGYRIDAVVGRGGMGVVYRATELALDRPVALKLIAPELADDPSFRERFLRESRLTASIDHPGILPVYAAGEVEGKLYLATRFVDGTDLRELLERDGLLAAARALELVGQLADALDAAHRDGLVHRDVKPGNVLFDATEHCYLCDFGLTTQVGAGDSTATGRLAGSLDYLAPEQIRHGEVDGRTDEYALACVLYECLSGAPPFRRETEAQTLWAHMQEEPAPLPEYPELGPVFARALAKERDHRYETCDAFVEDARAALGLRPSLGAVRRRRRRFGGRLLYAGVALLAVSVSAAVIALTLGSSDPLVAPPNSVGIIDPATNRLVGQVPVGATPTQIDVGEGSVWVTNADDRTVSQIDPASRTLVRTFAVETTPTDVVAAFGAVWVGGRDPPEVRRLDPRSGVVSQRIVFSRPPREGLLGTFASGVKLTTGGGSLWASAAGVAQDELLARIDPGAGRITATIRPVHAGPLAAGAGSIWMIQFGTLTRVDVVTNEATRRTYAPSFHGEIVADSTFVWVADEFEDTIWQLDAGSRRLLRSIQVGMGAGGVALGFGSVWVASADGTVSRIDPASHRVVATIRVGGVPRRIAAGAGSVWVTVS